MSKLTEVTCHGIISSLSNLGKERKSAEKINHVEVPGSPSTRRELTLITRHCEGQLAGELRLACHQF